MEKHGVVLCGAGHSSWKLQRKTNTKQEGGEIMRMVTGYHKSCNKTKEGDVVKEGFLEEMAGEPSNKKCCHRAWHTVSTG